LLKEADMAENTRSGKKDQNAQREVNADVEELVRPTGTKPQVRDPNRDRARGDWDRSGRLDDEGTEIPNQ
jgi:hypothetical protein